MVMLSILIITLIALVVFLLLNGFIIMRDFSRTWLRYGAKHIFRVKQGINYYCELSVILLVVLIMAVASSVLKGAVTILATTVTTVDIAQFTTALRGTFSFYTTEIQSSSNHILLFFINPVLKMLAVLTLTCGIKMIFTRINEKAGGDCFNEADALYFSSLGVIFIIAIEILCHIQDVRLANMAGNIAYLLLDKFAYILIFLTMEEVIMLSSNKKRLLQTIDKYLITNHIEKKSILSGWKLAAFAYVLCLTMALPCFLGFQWIRDNTSLMTVFIIVLGIALIVMKRVFSNAWNLLGTVIFANTFSMHIIPLSNKSRLPVFWGLFVTGVLLVAFGIFYTKQLIMLFLIMAMAVSIITTGVVVTYYLSLGISSLLAGITSKDITPISLKRCFIYVGWVLSSLFRALASPAFIVMVAFMVVTCFPKTLKCEEIVANSSVIDTNGDWLYIDQEQSYYYAPVKYIELPEFFKRALVYQEDRSFFRQGEILPNTSNWHGVSLSVFRGRGGSNINAQLCKNVTFLDADGFPRDMSRKLAEVISGYMISQKETPEHIMELYTNVASFHGTFAGFRGINAASLYAFGKPINKLNHLQQLYLVNTLPRSISVKGDNVNIAYNEVQCDSTGQVKTVLLTKAKRWCDEGLISKKELNALKREELDFTNSRFISKIPIATRIRIENNLSAPGRHLSYITLENEEAMVRAYNKLQNSNIFRKRGAELEVASIVVDIHNGHIIAHYSSGIIDYTNYRDGFAIGSLGKPFIVMQMLEMGASPKITLYDGQIAGRKTPKNANHGWSKRYVTITEALSKSLNAPFVNIFPIMNPKNVFIKTERSYAGMGIRSEKRHTEMCEDTYNYPLGNRQMFVTEVAQAFQTLLNDGVCYPISDHETRDTIAPLRIYNPQNVAVVKKALSQTVVSGTMKAYRSMLPKGHIYYAKTGTSTRQQYGWAVISDGDLLVVSLASYGKSLGNKMKLGIEPLYGSSTAGLMSVLVYKEIMNK